MTDAANDVPSLGERITDPRRVRALAHPLRLELLDLLHEGELTATRCAEATGESVASCSFHLRTLAKYGYIVRGEPVGREKPWRLVSRSHDIRPDHVDPASIRAVGTVAGYALEHAVELVRAWIDQIVDEDPAWVDATTITTSSVWMTQAELAELSTTIQHLTDWVDGRDENPSLRPPGARPVRVLGIASLDVERERRSPGPLP